MNKPKNHLPNSAKMVFKGKTYEVWQWEQEMYDGSMKIFEKLKRLNTVTILVVIDGKLVIQEQEQPHRDSFISLPGGRCEIGEEPLESAKRELLEETGYISQSIFLWKIIPSAYSSIIRDSYYYIAKDCKKIQNLNLDNGEKIQNKFITFEEFLLLSDDERFRDTDLSTILLRLRLDEITKKQFRKLLFD